MDHHVERPKNFAMTVHTVFCGECGGWVQPEIEHIVPYEFFIKCDCGEILLMVRTVEPRPIERHA